MEKKYILFAGVNGAGKTTIYYKNANGFENFTRINSDEILRETSDDWESPILQMQAMKEAARRIRESLDKGASFIQETTLTGHSIIRNIEKAKQLGYDLEVHYIGLENADLAVERVAHRVKCGGHGIKEEDIRRRYKDSLQNLSYIIPLCNSLHIYDNSICYRKVAFFKDGKEIYRTSCEWLDKALLTK